MPDKNCKFCIWHRLGGYWQSECTNKDCQWYGEECIEKHPYESIECINKENK